MLRFEAEHFRHRRTEDVGIEQSHFVAKLRKSHSKVGSNGRFAHTAFARRYADDIFHAGERALRLWSGRFADDCGDVAFNVDFVANVCEKCCFGRLDERFHEWVGRLVENQRERHFVAVDAYVVGYHARADNIFASARVAHFGESVEYEFWI